MRIVHETLRGQFAKHCYTIESNLTMLCSKKFHATPRNLEKATPFKLKKQKITPITHTPCIKQCKI